MVLRACSGLAVHATIGLNAIEAGFMYLVHVVHTVAGCDDLKAWMWMPRCLIASAGLALLRASMDDTNG